MAWLLITRCARYALQDTVQLEDVMKKAAVDILEHIIWWNQSRFYISVMLT